MTDLEPDWLQENNDQNNRFQIGYTELSLIADTILVGTELYISTQDP